MSEAPHTVRFLDFLGSERTLRSTDDVLAITLPLLQQTVDVHERGRVAPLDGVDEIQFANGALWFEHAKTLLPRNADAALLRIERAESLAFEVTSHFKRVDDDEGTHISNLGVVESDAKIERPSYCTRYVSWEHQLEHHDPLTDIFMLGMVMASVALDQNLADAESLSAFVRSRSNLAAANPRLHPVVARAIVRMTEVQRHKRVQDLPALVTTLRNYREQTLGLDEPISASPSTHSSRKQVYGRLRDRLFDFSRRNRLLHFVPSGQTVNLTLGSVPLVLDVKSISPDALLTWRGRAAQEIASAKPVPLGRYLRFEDYPFLASSLDQLRLDATRSKNELGFSPLRLSICFLHWHNLKEAKDTRITSPLLLLPVTLEKKKGVRDAVLLTAESEHAEVNPVLRQYLAQLYGVHLPASVDLSDPNAIESLLTELLAQVQASEPGVTISKVDKPRIDMILAQAKKRLETYRKRVSLSGRSVRSHKGFDYSYARGKFHPLGIQLFSHLVYPSAAPNRELHEAPRPRIFRHSPEVVEKSMYALQDGGTNGGPYEWALDLCSVTLANFNYRKMSLVRDYAGLLDSNEAHASFDAMFSANARPVVEAPPPIPPEERFDVMPADPTQASAVARARRGECFIIQGPPGTGKSQTITNLIADYVARGKRVLFVCEKRAAIDVVYHRLRMQGLAPLTCLIHDSQADKKAFIKDLKDTYEDWIARPANQELDDNRRQAAAQFGGVLGRATRFRAAMQAHPPGASRTTLSLLVRALDLIDLPPSGIPKARLPTHNVFTASAPALRALEQGLRALGKDALFARHPLRMLSDEMLFAELPVVSVGDESKALLQTLDQLADSHVTRVGTLTTMGHLVDRIGFINAIRPLLSEGALGLLDVSGASRNAFDTWRREIAERSSAARKAALAAIGWHREIPADEVSTALALARRYEDSLLYRMFGWLSPTWWRLRALLHRSFDFASKSLHPAWSVILANLQAKYQADVALAEANERACVQLCVGDLEGVGAALDAVPSLSSDLLEFQRWLVTPGAQSDAAGLLRVADEAANLPARVARLVRGFETLTPREARDSIVALESGLGDLNGLLEPLRKLAVPEYASVASLVREYAVTADQLERDVCRAEVDAGLRQHAGDLLTGVDWDTLRDEALRTGAEVRRANADAVVERARNAFLERVRISNAPADTLTAAQKKEKRAYISGRKELEHEFGKVTRHRAIRDLATANAGAVVRDLKPVWLMSPLSVADTLPLDATFDVVIFDEASQIPLEDAIPAAHRAAQTIVVGDEMQLPPTDFFGISRTDDAENIVEETGYELDANSLLTHAARTLPSTMLGWHYRSRDEALIAFSNRVFYEGKLLTVPSVTSLTARTPIVARHASDGVQGADALLERSISFHHIEKSPYEQRRNIGEARYIAEMLRRLLSGNSGQTVGVVAFSEAQQGEIESAVRQLAEQDAQFGVRYEAEMEREEDGQHVGLFVKNLENVQGDERDIIIISVCYGPDANGRMLMNFGPINKTGGEKRLNVIFSRARHHLALVSSIRWNAITNEYNDGANCLRNYLRYAEAMSTGAADDAQAALQAYARKEALRSAPHAESLEDRLARALRDRGYQVDIGVGSSEFRCNLGVRARGDTRYQLGILLDDAAHQSRAVDELLHTQPSVLRAFGWNTMTVLHKDWYSDPETVLQRVKTAMAHEPQASSPVGVLADLPQ